MRVHFAFLALLTVSVLCSRPVAALDREPATINAWPPAHEGHCWVSHHLVFDIPDTLCWGQIWDWSGFQLGDVVGMSYMPDGTCDWECQHLSHLTIYFPQALDGPGDEIEIRVYCADQDGCAIGDQVYSQVVDPHQGANSIDLGALSLSQCTIEQGVRYVVTLCWLTDSGYPHIATDNMETLADQGCEFPPGYPRSDPHSTQSYVFSGSSECVPACPWDWFSDNLDNLALVWRFGMTCEGGVSTQSVSMGELKLIFR